MTARSRDVVIIGAGMIGADIAFELAKKGWRLVNVDKPLPAGFEATNAKRGLVDLHDVSDDWIPIYDKSDLDGFYTHPVTTT